MPRRKSTDTAGRPLTREEAAYMVDSWSTELFDNNETIGDFLWLIRSLAYSNDLTYREELLTSIESALLPYVQGVDHILADVVTARVREMDRWASGGR